MTSGVRRPLLRRASVAAMGLAMIATVATVPASTGVASASPTVAPSATKALGDLRVVITGLPLRVAASLTVKGPSYPRGITVTASRTLANLKPGIYTVSARSLATTKGRLVPAPASRFLTVVKAKAVAATIAYTFVGQPVTVALRVNGRVGGVAVPSKPTQVALVLTNRSKVRSINGFTVVVPRGAGAVTAKSITGRGQWTLTLRSCGRTPSCSSLVVAAPRVTRAFPLSRSVILPRGSASVALTFRSPATRNRYPVSLLNIGAGYFTVSGAPAVLQVFPSQTVTAVPHQPVPLVPLAVGTNSRAIASLPNGAYGTVSLFDEPAPCSNGLTPPCDTVTLDGTFTNPSNPSQHLYSNAAPAKVTFTCSAAKCPPTKTATADQVRAGGEVSCVITTDLNLVCWGNDGAGQLGTVAIPGSDTEHPQPQLVPGVGTVRDVAVGFRHTCAVTAAAEAECWGTNDTGQLGRDTNLGTATPLLTPTVVSGISGATAVTAGTHHTCVLINGDQPTGGSVKCWGEGSSGQLGNGANSLSTAPVAVAGITTAVQVSAGTNHTCAVLDSGGVQCWGDNTNGQLGNPSLSQVGSDTPITVTGVTTAVEVSAAGNHTCARLNDGTVECWGDNVYGQLGSVTNSGTTIPTPTAQLVSLPGNAISIAAGGSEQNSEHTCAVLSDNTTWCWGDNFSGQLGTSTGMGASAPNPTPVAVPVTASAVVAGVQHTCVLLTDNTVWCWGDSQYGQLGVVPGTPVSTSNPNHVLGIEATPDPLNDAVTYPLSVSIKQGGVYLPFTPAPPCTDIPAIGTPTGRLASVTAQTLGFCFDIYATSRDASNTLSRTILFVEDPKFTAISR